MLLYSRDDPPPGAIFIQAYGPHETPIFLDLQHGGFLLESAAGVGFRVYQSLADVREAIDTQLPEQTREALLVNAAHFYVSEKITMRWIADLRCWQEVGGSRRFPHHRGATRDKPAMIAVPYSKETERMITDRMEFLIGMEQVLEAQLHATRKSNAVAWEVFTRDLPTLETPT